MTAQIRSEISEQMQGIREEISSQIKALGSLVSETLQQEMEERIQAEVDKQVGRIRSDVQNMVDTSLANRLHDAGTPETSSVN